jgi:hypothetical protein
MKVSNYCNWVLILFLDLKLIKECKISFVLLSTQYLWNEVLQGVDTVHVRKTIFKWNSRALTP